jgi:DNA-binding MarR family transcriptional regulator
VEQDVETRERACEVHWDVQPVDLSQVGEAQRRVALMDQTARFVGAFMRWGDAHACDGLSVQQMRLLKILHCGGPAIMREIGAELGVTSRNMTAMVDSLEQSKLVVRRPHPEDRRATLVELTPEGNRAASDAMTQHFDAMAEIFAGFSVAEQSDFYLALNRLIDAMGAKSCKPPQAPGSRQTP